MLATFFSVLCCFSEIKFQCFLISYIEFYSIDINHHRKEFIWNKFDTREKMSKSWCWVG